MNDPNIVFWKTFNKQISAMFSVRKLCAKPEVERRGLMRLLLFTTISCAFYTCSAIGAGIGLGWLPTLLPGCQVNLLCFVSRPYICTTRLGGTSWAWGKPTWKNMFTKLIQNTPLSYRVNRINLGTHGNTSPFPTSKLIAFSDLMHMVATPHQSWLVLDCQWLAHNPTHNTMIG